MVRALRLQGRQRSVFALDGVTTIETRGRYPGVGNLEREGARLAVSMKSRNPRVNIADLHEQIRAERHHATGDAYLAFTNSFV
jgi:hypothetical protein